MTIWTNKDKYWMNLLQIKHAQMHQSPQICKPVWKVSSIKSYLILPVHDYTHCILIRRWKIGIFLKKTLYHWRLRINLQTRLRSNLVLKMCWEFLIQVIKGQQRKHNTSIRSFCLLLSNLSTATAISCNCFSNFSLSSCSFFFLQNENKKNKQSEWKSTNHRSTSITFSSVLISD